MPAKLAGFIFLEILPATATAAKKPTTTKVKEIKLSLSSPAAAVATSGGSDPPGSDFSGEDEAGLKRRRRRRR